MRVDSMKIDYAATEPGEEVVISGIAGRFPESKNVIELKNNLFSKTDMVTDNSSRWTTDNPEIPRENGKVHGLSKFDAIFFGIHYKQVEAMDPMCRMVLEHSYEAIIDAGINPRQLRGTNTGVVVGTIYSDGEKSLVFEQPPTDGYAIMGCSKGMMANRISYVLDVHGPSYGIDTACSSSMTALDLSYRMIRTGICDAVIVAGSNLCLQSSITIHFKRLGAASSDCRCKSFDESGDGYVRSEAVTAILVQKAKDAKRIYAQIVYTRSNSDGYKELGLSHPANEGQKMLLTDFYNECKIPPSAVSFVEAHGTGTKVGDPEEIIAIGSVFCKGRSTPLPVGSIKSNMGHSEAASGLCSIAKVIIAMETGIIPPNLHFKSPLKGIKYFEEGKIQVITENTPWEGGYAAINSFGIGGSNTHVLLKSHTKEKVNNGSPSDDLPRLVIASGRTEEAMETLLSYVESIPVDVEYIRLLHEVYSEDIRGHLFRGYSIVGSKISKKPPRVIQEYTGLKRPICFVFSGMGSEWTGMGDALMRFPIFAKAIQKCDAALKPYGVDVVDIITNKDEKIFDNILNSFVGIVAIQIGLVDMLTAVDIEPDIMIGHSVGELGCAYADGCCTAEQVVVSAYFSGLASIQTKTVRGSMAAVGLGYKDIKQMCPSDIEVACHNGPDSSTISGPAESMKEFVAKLQANNIFAKEVPCGNIAYHSRYVAEVGDKLLVYLKRVIREPKPRSAKWLSTSVPRNRWSTTAARYASAEYYTNNLRNYVLFAETATRIPPNATAIEIAPHGLMQAILKSSLNPNVINVPLLQRGHKDNAEHFLQALGNLYNVGLQPQVANLYPHVEFPVSRGTPMISPHIEWDHSQDWFVPNGTQTGTAASTERIVEITLKDEKYEYMKHHIVNERNLIPATGYLTLAWETLSLLEGKPCDQVSVVFENVKFEPVTTIPAEGSIQLIITIHRGSGSFEISKGSSIVASGLIRKMNDPSREKIPSEFLTETDDEEALNAEDIYKELTVRGYQYTGPFSALTSATLKRTRGRIAWLNNWTTFLDNMLQLQILSMNTKSLYVVVAIGKLVIDVGVHKEKIRHFSDSKNELPVQMYNEYNAIISGGVEIRESKMSIIQPRNLLTPMLAEYKFVANRDRAHTSLEDMVTMSMRFALDNNIIYDPKIMELINADDNIPDEELLTPMFVRESAKLMKFCPRLTLIAKSDVFEKLSPSEDFTMIEANKLPKDGSVFMIATRNVLLKSNRATLDQILRATTDYGYILTRESTVNNDTFVYLHRCGLNVILEKTFKNETLLLLQKQQKPPQKREVLFVNNYEFSWIEKIKEILMYCETRKNKEKVELILVAEGDLQNGILGFVKTLKREPNGDIVKAVIIQDLNAPKFSLDDPFYRKQLDIGIAINILNPGKVWGTYTYLPYPPLKPVSVYHGFVDLKVKGNMNSIEWVQGPIQPDDKSNDGNIVKVVYSSLNFRDVVLASGKLLPDIFTSTKRGPMGQCCIGIEFSGIDSNGRRVMGLVESGAISNLVAPSKCNIWPVPKEWSLEDAATIPVAYFTVIYSFFYFGRLKKGEKVLIHSGCGAVGQAAINIALAEGCEIFTTVGTPEKRQFIKETFPSIDDDHIGNSRDTSFEQMVMKQTKGKGVDIVLNSLAKDKLVASIRCLGYRGRFLEIGKVDIVANSSLGMEIFLKQISFHGVGLDKVISADGSKVMEELSCIFNAYLKAKVIKPLVRTCFEKHQINDAFKYMESGKHIGKILIKIGDEKQSLPSPVMAVPRFYAAQDKTYIMVGGLGGLGLEITDWMIQRGARNFLMVSRSGVNDGYQRMMLDRWKTYGAKVRVISGVDLSKTNECESVLRSAEKESPVDGIFNLALVVSDSLLINQTEKSFEKVMKPKAGVTKKLDELSRKICPSLRYFIAFSSVTSGVGTAGLSNYSMSNCVLDRICEQRVADGLPGMAIQWGPIGDVGLVANRMRRKQEVQLNGALPQKMASCLEEVDKFLSQCKPIVISMVVEEKQRNESKSANLFDAVMNIMGIKDVKTVSQFSSLAELGMDSIMIGEIKQILEQDFELFLTTKDIRALNLSKLAEMSTNDFKMADIDTKQSSIDSLLNYFNEYVLSTEHCTELPVKCVEKNDEVFLIPGVEGSILVFFKIASSLKHPATCLQLGVHDTDKSVEEMAERLLPHILERSNGRKDFKIVGYSYGSMIAIELARRLEARGLVGHLILIDGSPDYVKAMIDFFSPPYTENELQNKVLYNLVPASDSVTFQKFQLELEGCSTWAEKLDTVLKFTPAEFNKIFTTEDQKAIYSFLLKRIRAAKRYEPYSSPPLKTPITLLKPTIPIMPANDESYGLAKVTTGKVTVHIIEGDHASIFDNSKIAAVINDEPLVAK